jgi:polysaccharide chain length determinant protein (PEP-CTERM system associated)
MNSGYRQLSLPGPGGERLPTLTMISLARKEFRRYLLPFASIFAAIAFFFLAWGMLNPPTYKSSATVLVQDNSPVTPLMDGRPVDSNDPSQATISRDVLFGRRVMEEILRAGGWLDDHPSPVEKDRLIGQIISRTEIVVTNQPTSTRSSDPKLSLVKITYSDSDAKRAYAVAKRFSEALIEQVLNSKATASRSAYQFIDAQVATYQQALGEADSKLQQYRSGNPDALPGVDSDVASRIGELRRAVDNARMDLADVGAQEGQVMAQLSRESQVATVPRSAQFDSQLAALEAERDRLELAYTDQYPDVIRVKNQIRDLQAQRSSGRASGSSVLAGSTPSLNPVYGQLRTQLAEVRRQGAAAASRVATAQALLEQELARSRKIIGSEPTVTALTRAKDVNQQMYEDLLKRRENARVSMRLDAEGRSLGFQIQEPASLPLLPSGLRLMHFAVTGLLFATLVPLLLLSLLVKHDPRVRTPLQIEREAGLPVLASIPIHLTHAQHVQEAKRHRLGSALFVAVPLVYGLVLLLKLVDVL